MSATINFKLTSAGVDEAFYKAGQTLDLNVTHAQIGDGNRTPNGNEVALVSGRETATITSHIEISTEQHRVAAAFLGSALSFNISEIGLWSGAPGESGSVLVFYWSQASGHVAVKTADVEFNFESDIFFGGVVPGNITIVADVVNNALSLIAAHEAAPDPHDTYATKLGVQGDAYSSASAGGTHDAISASFTPAIPDLSKGWLVRVRASAANETATPTFTPNSGVVTPKTIVKGNNFPLVAGDIAGAGYWIELRYDLTLDKWVLANPARGVSNASATVSGSARNLHSSATGANANISISADEIVVKNALGESVALNSVAVVLNTATVGVNGLDSGTLAANTWYDRYIIYNGTTPAALMCVSGNSPVMPAGYTYKAYVGAWLTDNTVNKFPLAIKQAGGKFQLASLLAMANGVQGSGFSSATPTWAAIAVKGVAAAPNASVVYFTVACYTNSAGAQFIIAPNNQCSGLGSSVNPPPEGSNGYGWANFKGRLLLESTNIYYVSASASLTLYCGGWEEEL